MPARHRIALLLALAAAAPPAAAQPADEVAFARFFLDHLQRRSFLEGREFCGFFGRDAQGRIVATKPRRGTSHSCYLGGGLAGIVFFATYHTHASYDPASYDEVPSTNDLRSDNARGLDGYISTPGGRLWFSHGESLTAWQLCGAGCLPQDPRYRPDPSFAVAERYTLDELIRLMGD
jgi:hypothetical protein